jgi:hypothetical protein
MNGPAARSPRTLPACLRLPPLEGPAWREALLLILILCATFLWSSRPVLDPDTFWHLAVGREMWQTGHVVRTETFSFTAPGAPWVDEEWLFHALAYPLWRLGGDDLLRLVTAACAALAAALAYRSARLLGGAAATFALWFLPLLGVYSERFRFRPEIASIVFMAVLLEVLLRWPEAPAGWRARLPWLLPLFWLWIQLHGAWAYGMVLLCAFLGGGLLQRWKEGRLSWRLAATALIPPAATFGVLFLNPLGWRLPLFPVRHALSLLGEREAYVPIAEWARTPFTGVYALFSVLVLLLLGAVLLERGRFRWPEFALVASQAALGLYWVRYAAYTVIALAPSAASRLAAPFKADLARRVLLACAFAGAGAAVAWPLLRPTAYPTLAQRYPEHEAAFLRDNGLEGNVFHEFRVGGYLEWVLPGPTKIFLDGRYGPFNEVGMQYYGAHKTVEAFRALLDRYPAEIAIYGHPGGQIRPDPKGPPRGPSALLFPREQWALVYMGDYGMVLLRRLPRWQQAIARFEYPVLRPDDLPYLLSLAATDHGMRDALAADMTRALGQNPPTGLALLMRQALGLLQIPVPASAAPEKRP